MSNTGVALPPLLLMYWAAGGLGLIMTNRSRVRSMAAMFREPNAALWWVVCGAGTMSGLVLHVPPCGSCFLLVCCGLKVSGCACQRITVTVGLLPGG